MKYDWQISRLEDRIKDLEEIVCFLQQELEKSVVYKNHDHYRDSPFYVDPTAWQKDVQ